MTDTQTHTYTHTLVVSHDYIRKAKIVSFGSLKIWPMPPVPSFKVCCRVEDSTWLCRCNSATCAWVHGQQWMSVATISRHIPVMGLEHGNGWNPKRLQGFYLDDPVKVLCNSWIFKSCHIHWMHLDALPSLSVNHLSRLMFRGFPRDISDLHSFFMLCHAFPNLNRPAPG